MFQDPDREEARKAGVDQARSIILQERQRLQALQAKTFDGTRAKMIATLTRLERRVWKAR